MQCHTVSALLCLKHMSEACTSSSHTAGDSAIHHLSIAALFCAQNLSNPAVGSGGGAVRYGGGAVKYGGGEGSQLWCL